MRFIVTADGFSNKGKINDVTVLAKKINGFWVKNGNSVGFVCNHDIRIVSMSDEEQTMPVYWQPGYPGKND